MRRSAVLLLVATTIAYAETGLDFPGSAAVPDGDTIRFSFSDPDLNGLPIYGPGDGGVTFIWRAYPREQTACGGPCYYTTFFWGNDDGQGRLATFLWDNGYSNSYYGAHPYPTPSTGALEWEIAVESGDYVTGVTPEWGRWHLQAFRAWSDANGKHHEFYFDLPYTDEAHRILRTSASSWGNTNPPYPSLTWGDAPWNPGAEVYDGIIRGIQIYSTLLSTTDILSEAALPLSTPSGTNHIWYLNLNPTPTDIVDHSGRGNHPAWVGDRRPALWESTDPLIRRGPRGTTLRGGSSPRMPRRPQQQ